MPATNHTPLIPLKQCSLKEKCVHPNGSWLPATTEFFSKHKGCKDGLRSHCKACQKAKDAEYYATHRDEIIRKSTQYKRDHAEQTREKSRQFETRNREKRRIQRKRTYAANPEKYRAKGRRWRENNLEKAIEQERNKRERNRDRLNELARQRRKANPELFRENQRRYIERDPERRKAIYRKSYYRHHEKRKAASREYLHTHKHQKREYYRNWKRANPERYRYLRNTGNARRYARIKSLPADFTAADWEHCLEYWNYRCCICGNPAGLWHVIAQEHWIPLSDPRPDNPGTVPSNILPMCHTMKDGEGGCNNSKHNRDPIVWLNERLGKHRAQEILTRIEAYFEWVRANRD